MKLKNNLLIFALVAIISINSPLSICGGALLDGKTAITENYNNISKEPIVAEDTAVSSGSINMDDVITSSGGLTFNVYDYLKTKPINISNIIYNASSTNQTFSKEFFGDMLDSNAHNIYNYIKTELATPGTNVSTYNFNNASISKAEAENAAARAYSALWLDNPKLFWLSSYAKATSKPEYGSYAQSVTITVEPYYADKTKAELIQMKNDITNNVNLAISSISIKRAKTDTDKLIKLHHYLVTHAQYDNQGNIYSQSAAPSYHDVYGTLVNGAAVCEGYARALQLLCQEKNIPCIAVIGYKKSKTGTTVAHSWNYVFLNNKWYFLDASANDQYMSFLGSQYYYKFFLCPQPSYYYEDPQFDDINPANSFAIMYGDADLNGQITMSDGAFALQYTLDKSFDNITYTGILACEVDANTSIDEDSGQISITANDAATIQNAVLNYDDHFAISDAILKWQKLLYDLMK